MSYHLIGSQKNEWGTTMSNADRGERWCHACYHGDCPGRCPDDMCRGSCECECDLYDDGEEGDSPAGDLAREDEQMRTDDYRDFRAGQL